MDKMAASRERRKNVGQQMQKLIEDEAEDDFYKTTYGGFEEEEGDNEYEAEEEEEDVADFDFVDFDIQQEGDETWPDPAFGPNQIDVSLKLLNDLNACSVSEDNHNEMELQSMEKTDTRYKCSGQSQPPPLYQNQMHSECGVAGPDLEVGQTEVNLLNYQEPEVEGTSGADADIIKNTEEQSEDTKEDKIQPNLEPQAQSEYQRGSQSQVEADDEADDEDNRDEQALALLFADTLLKYLAKRKVKGKTNYKFDGTLDELKDFVSLVLKRKGKWTGKKNTGKQTFSDSKVKLTLSWWPTSKTLQLQGTNENVENFESKLDNLLESIQKINPTKNEDSTNLNEKSSTISEPEKRKRTKKPETHIQCDSREEGEVNAKQKSGEVWHAISQLKEQLLKLSELVSGKTGTKTNNSPTLIMSQAKESCWLPLQTLKICLKWLTKEI